MLGMALPATGADVTTRVISNYSGIGFTHAQYIPVHDPPWGWDNSTHVGIDLAAPSGTALYSFADGVVFATCGVGRPLTSTQAGTCGNTSYGGDLRALGNAVMVHHPQFGQVYSIYLHMRDTPLVDVNTPVTAGVTQLGVVGQTGSADGNHVHFEIRRFPKWYFGWNNGSVYNIYGPGDKRGSAELANWENPQATELVGLGSLVQAVGSNDVHWLQGGRAHHVLDASVLTAMQNAEAEGWNWASISTVGSLPATGPGFLAPDDRSNGILVRDPTLPETYVMEGGKRRWIKTWEALNWLGQDWSSRVILVPASVLQSLAPTNGNPVFEIGQGEPNASIKNAIVAAYTRNAGECPSAASWTGWPGAHSECLRFPITSVGPAFVSGASGNGGKYQNFGSDWADIGTINSSPRGTFAVHGAIYTKYKELGYSGSALGFPTSDEYTWNGLQTSDFEGGYITWNPSTDATSVVFGAPTCSSFSLSQSSASPSAANGQATVSLTGSPAGCTGGSWSASGNGSWITVNPPSGVGAQTVTVFWTQNTGGQRTGWANIANNSFAVNQAAAMCTSFSIWPTFATPTAASGQTTVTLTGSPSGCTGGSWTASGNGSWITVSPVSGAGAQAVTVFWSQNTGSQRSGSANIANNTLAVTQAAASAPTCTSFSPSQNSANPSAATGQTMVTLTGLPSGCTGGSWSASGNGSWISVNPTSGIGPQTVTVSWTSNTGSQRSGSANIANSAFVVTQAAATCTSFSIWPASANPPAASGQTTVTLTGSPSGCTGGNWTANGNVAWITVSPTSGVGAQTVTVSWTQNLWSQRSGSANIANNTFAVTQAAAGAPTCTSFSLAFSATTPPATSGQVGVSLTGSPSGCGGGSWTASGNGSWITVSPTSGSGPQTVTVSWPQNTGGQRSDWATIAGNGFLVTQAADPGGAAQLSNGVPYSDSLTASVAQQGWKYYTIEVPPGAATLDVRLDNMSADVDLYLSEDSPPTLGWYDCRPYIGGPLPETCSVQNPPAGTWWIGVNNWDVGTISYDVTASYAISSCQYFLCEDFDAPLSGWTLSGVAQQTVGGQLELTPADTWKWGTIARDPLTFIDRFTARFRLEVSRPDTGFGADGVTFAVIEDGPSLSGNYGSSMGYGGLWGRSFAIEFDTYANWELGETGTHVGLDVDGSVFSVASSPISAIRNEGPIDVRVVFDRGWVRVFLQGGTAYPAETLVLSATVPNWQPFDGRFAFTAGTGGYGEVHSIDDLTIDLVADAPSVTEAVTWTGAKGVLVTGGSLRKTAPTAWGNAGAISSKSLLSGDGYVEFKATDAKTFRILGLSNGDANHNWKDVDFGLYLTSTKQVRVYEGGVSRGAFGSYSAGDVFRVSVESGIVKYHRNGTLLYTSTVLPTYPLLVDNALYTKGATLTNVVISGSWQSPPLLPPAGEAAAWTKAVGVSAWGNDLSKVAATGWGNAGASSTKFLPAGDGYVEFMASEANTGRILGLSNGDSNRQLTDVDFGVYLNLDGRVFIYEKGVSRGVFGTYAPGDLFRVSVEAGFVTYRRNGALLRTSKPPVYPLLVDTALYSAGATLTNVVISGAWR